MTKYDEPMAVKGTDIRLTVERLEALKKVSGLSFSECMNAEDAVRLRALAFLELYRRDSPAGFEELGQKPDPDDLWERAAKIELYFGDVGPPGLDPTGGGSWTTSPSSADIGE